MDHPLHVIPADEMYALLGTAHGPHIIDVTLPEDVAADPWRLPTAMPVHHRDVLDAVPFLDPGRPVVTVCQKGLKLSQGAAALLRAAGIGARALQGGNLAWQAADHPRLACDLAPDMGTAWVLPATRDRGALAAAWTVMRWFDRNARVMWVAPDHVSAVADRFGATLHDPDTSLTTNFAARGLIHPALVVFLDRVEDGTAPGTVLMDMLPDLHVRDEDCATAGLPFLDAAWTAFCRSSGQEAG
ncbi:rhodanese-like domain-containing protein [uncultured Tateyamaria sp.]|uniref:rhodanese-like domain-containing protein n=1 Tax=uncultured Tateyamaria sp. TaxID=455651 RepID=UPI002622E4A7|nr:rhodanese-like domain-containing protein [uncultured Tateyamaria sp.]